MTIQSENVTLFVVEDDDIDYMMIQRTMKHLHVANQLVRAVDGQDALDKLNSQQVNSPFVMLLDLKMPKVSGLELLIKLRQTPTLRDTIVFVLSSSDDEQDIQASYQQNVAGYFVKNEIDSEFADILTLLHGFWRTAHIPGVRV